MGAHRYYHNTTKNLLNESDSGDFLDCYDEGDTVFYTERGDATLTILTAKEIKELEQQRDYEEE